MKCMFDGSVFKCNLTMYEYKDNYDERITNHNEIESQLK